MSKSDTKAVWAAQAEDVASAGIGVAVLYFRRGRELRKSEPYEVRVFADPTDYLNWLRCHKGVMT